MALVQHIQLTDNRPSVKENLSQNIFCFEIDISVINYNNKYCKNINCLKTRIILLCSKMFGGASRFFLKNLILIFPVAPEKKKTHERYLRPQKRKIVFCDSHSQENSAQVDCSFIRTHELARDSETLRRVALQSVRLIAWPVGENLPTIFFIV